MAHSVHPRRKTTSGDPQRTRTSLAAAALASRTAWASSPALAAETDQHFGLPDEMLRSCNRAKRSLNGIHLNRALRAPGAARGARQRCCRADPIEAELQPVGRTTSVVRRIICSACAGERLCADSAARCWEIAGSRTRRAAGSSSKARRTTSTAARSGNCCKAASRRRLPTHATGGAMSDQMSMREGSHKTNLSPSGGRQGDCVRCPSQRGRRRNRSTFAIVEAGWKLNDGKVFGPLCQASLAVTFSRPWGTTAALAGCATARPSRHSRS